MDRTTDISSTSQTGNRIHYAATRDGERFLVNSLVGEESDPGIRVVLDWNPPTEER